MIIDERNIEIENMNFRAIFDTGASDNMICSGAIKDLKNIPVLPGEKEYKYFGCK